MIQLTINQLEKHLAKLKFRFNFNEINGIKDAENENDIKETEILIEHWKSKL